MKHLSVPAFLGIFTLTWPLVSAQAQMGFSPSAPPVTSSGFPRSNSSTMPVQPAQAATAGTAVPGGYVMVPQQALSNEPIDPDHKLNRGDQLSFRVQEDRDDKIWPLTVTDSGEVQLPLGGRVKAAGKSTRQLTADIKSMLEHDYYYHATVDLGLVAVAARASRGRVYVSGAVKQVGSVELPLDAPLTASEAIYQMGGPVDFSALKRTRVMRKGGPEKGIPVNIKAVEDGKLDQDVVLQPGDKVIVPEASFGWKF